MKLKYIVFIIILFCQIPCFAGNQTTSATDASVIATRARYYLNDPTTWGGTQKHIWSDAELLQWVNNGTLDIISKTKCLESTESITLIANTKEYTITGPYISLERAVYIDLSTGLERTLEKVSGEGHTKEVLPYFWYEWNGKIGVYPALKNITDANLAIGSTNTNVSTGAIVYYINNDKYTKAAVAAGTAPGDDVVPQNKYGAVALDIGADATIDAIESPGNAVGYTTAALASGSLPLPEDGHIRLGYVTVMKTDGVFTFGTTALNAANTTVAYTDTTPTVTLYFVSRPTAVGASDDVKVPAQYDNALILYVVAQAYLKDGQFTKGNSILNNDYRIELDRYRVDLSGMPKVQ